MTSQTCRQKIERLCFGGLSVLATALMIGCRASDQDSNIRSVPVGVLHSRSGTMALSENTVAEAELLAIEEINAAGGLKLKEQRVLIEPIEEDGLSDPDTFARKAAQLLDQRKVVVVFGGWTSASRKAMVPVFEERGGLLFYPVQYEGQECSHAVVYGGSVPNQQSDPAVRWMLNQRSRRLVLIGSDYVYPRTANRIIRAQADREGGVVVDERYIPLGDKEVESLIATIQAARSGGSVVVINTLNGDSNLTFFKALHQSGLSKDPLVTVLSFSVTEEEAMVIGQKALAGSFASWSYFQSLKSDASSSFAKKFRKRFGFHRVVNDPAEAAYSLVHLWAKAVERSGSTDPGKVRSALIGTAFDAPQGTLKITPNQHLNKRSLLGRADASGQFQVVKDFGVIKPQPWNPLLPESASRRCDHRP